MRGRKEGWKLRDAPETTENINQVKFAGRGRIYTGVWRANTLPVERLRVLRLYLSPFLRPPPARQPSFFLSVAPACGAASFLLRPAGAPRR